MWGLISPNIEQERDRKYPCGLCERSSQQGMEQVVKGVGSECCGASSLWHLQARLALKWCCWCSFFSKILVAQGALIDLPHGLLCDRLDTLGASVNLCTILSWPYGPGARDLGVVNLGKLSSQWCLHLRPAPLVIVESHPSVP